MDDYRARFKGWKCPIRGELTIAAHPWSIEAFRNDKRALQRQVQDATWAVIRKQISEPMPIDARLFLAKNLWTNGSA